MDSLILTMIAGLAFLAAAVFGLAAATLWLVNRKPPKWPLGLAGASLLTAMVVSSALPPGYDEGEVERIRRLHAQFAPRLEEYRSAHGIYPPSLETVGVATPATKYGPLRYSAWVREGKPAYELSMGDYAENGFVTFWDSGSGRSEWDLDQ